MRPARVSVRTDTRSEVEAFSFFWDVTQLHNVTMRFLLFYNTFYGERRRESDGRVLGDAAR